MKANKTMSHKFLKSTVKTSKNWNPSQGVSETVLRVKRALKSIGFQLLSLGFRGMDILKVNQGLDKPVEVNQELVYCQDVRRDPGVSIARLIKHGSGLYLTAKARCFEVQIWITYYTPCSKRSYHAGQRDPLRDIS